MKKELAILPQSVTGNEIPLHSPTLTSIHDHWKNHSLD